MAKVAVVETSPLAARLAMMVGGRVVAHPAEAQPDESMIMTASSSADVRAVQEAISGQRRPRVVIAWHLPEASLVQLLDVLGGSVPCLIGEPEPKELQAVLDGSSRGVEPHSHRRFAARYAVLESWLAQPAHT